MRKTIFFFGCLALLAAGCNKVQTVDVPTDDPVTPSLKFNITVNYDVDTRAVKRDWEAGDIIYVAPDISFVDEVKDPVTGVYYSANHGVFTMTYRVDEGWVPSLPDTEFENALRAMGAGKLAAVHISGGQTPEFEYDESQTFFKYLRATNSKDLGGVILSANAVEYTISDNTLTAKLSMTLDAPEGTYRYPVHFFLPSITEENVSHFTLCCTKFSPDRFANFLFGRPEYVIFGPTAARFEIADDSFCQPILGSYYAGGLEFVGMLNPDCKGKSTDFDLYVIDNKGTPVDSDDIIYHLPKTATLNGKEAIKLPPLTDSRWIVNSVRTDGKPGFDAFKDENQW